MKKIIMVHGAATDVNDILAYEKIIREKFGKDVGLETVNYDCNEKPRYTTNVEAVVVVAKGRVISYDLYQIIRSCKKPMYFFGMMQLWAVKQNKWLLNHIPTASMGTPVLVEFEKSDLERFPSGKSIDCVSENGNGNILIGILPAMVYNPAERGVRV
ncbi:MAG: hypothetical protein IKV94_00555 [Clostridia bacterium]|nr:hypothetical protein [Clostridia bacterium]